MKKNSTLCVIACYNEEYNLPNLFKDLKNHQVSEVADILFVDDASTDNSPQMISQMGFNCITHDKNKGYGQAVLSGFQYALDNGYESFILFPGDNQRSAKDLKFLIKTYNETAYDVVTGSKFHIYSDKYGPINRRLGNIIYSEMARILWGSPIKDVLSGFKIYSVEAVKDFLPILPQGYPFDICFSFYASKFGLQIMETPVDCRYDDHTSKMNSVIWVSIKMLTKLMYHLVAHRYICPVPQQLPKKIKKVS